MNDNARNTRTLIVSFVVAIMALIPLRFVEVGQMSSAIYDSPQVLGEVEVAQPVEEVVLPNSEPPVLEAPYADIEAQSVLGTTDETVIEGDCISREDSDVALGEYRARIEAGDLNSEEIDSVIANMVSIENGTCK